MSKVEKLITDNLAHWSLAIQNRKAVGRGSSKKINLYGIKKLRELILELAVRGKLVPQDPNDEPASVLLERIAAEKAQLVKDKKIKKPKALPEISEDEKPFKLPDGWEWTRLGFITNYGVCDKAEPIDVKGDTWILELEDVEKSTSKLIKKVRFKDRQFKSSKNKFIQGDVIYGKLRPYLDKVLVADEDGVCTTEMVPLRPYAAITSNFLRLAMKSPRFIKYANSSTHGMSLPRMGTDKARLALIPIVPENEQHRIVAKVDELMVLCDKLEQQTESSIDAHKVLVETLLATLINSKDNAELEQNWQRLATHFTTLFPLDARGENSIDQLKQTVLQLAVMGKLVPQNPNDEPASVLLEKIAAEKEQLIKDKKIKKQKLLSPITEDEKPFELPDGWEWSRIGNASLMTDYGLSTKTSKEALGVPVLKMGDIQSSQVILGRQQTVPESTEGLPELLLESRDLLYNRTNSAELVGKTGIFLGENEEYSYASYLIRIRTLKETKLPEFINMNMASPVFRKTQIMPYIKQQCGQANVNGTMMKNMVVAVAPETELPRILEKVDQLTTLCDQLKTQIQQAQQTRLHLADAMVETALAK